MNTPGRIVLPKRWSRAKRKLMRRGIQWLRMIEIPYKRMLDRLWGDPQSFEWKLAEALAADYIDDVKRANGNGGFVSRPA